MSVIEKLNKAEAALTALALVIKHEVKDSECKKDYFTLLQQACVALNKIRATQEMADWFKEFDWSRIK